MADYKQISVSLNRLMAQYRGELGFINSYRANDYSWNEFTTTCDTWKNALYFTWG